MVTKYSIIAAAIKLSDGLICLLPPPYRHPDILMSLPHGVRLAYGEPHGFLTSNGQFATREEAYKIAHAAGQIIFRDDATPTPGTLYTEDLW